VLLISTRRWERRPPCNSGKNYRWSDRQSCARSSRFGWCRGHLIRSSIVPNTVTDALGRFDWLELFLAAITCIASALRRPSGLRAPEFQPPPPPIPLMAMTSSMSGNENIEKSCTLTITAASTIPDKSRLKARHPAITDSHECVSPLKRYPPGVAMVGSQFTGRATTAGSVWKTCGRQITACS
jgi:hypothetical protein